MNRLGNSSATHHRWFFATLIVLLFILCWEVTPDGTGIALRYLHWQAPETCALRRMLQIPCPGCGTTRSLIMIAQAEWQLAWRYSIVGYPLSIVLVWQIPYRWWAWHQRTPGTVGTLLSGVHAGLWVMVVAVMLIQWLTRLAVALGSIR